MTQIAVNGIGRIGKLVLRALLHDGVDADIVLMNDVSGAPEQHALLLEFDTIHGRWPADFSYDAESIMIDGERITMCCEQKIQNLPLAELKVDLVIDCTGGVQNARVVATLL